MIACAPLRYFIKVKTNMTHFHFSSFIFFLPEHSTVCRVWVSQREQGGGLELPSKPTHRRRASRLDNRDFQHILQEGFKIMETKQLKQNHKRFPSDLVRKKNPSHVLHPAPHLLLFLLHLRQLLRHPTLVQLLQGFLRQWHQSNFGSKQFKLHIPAPQRWTGLGCRFMIVIRCTKYEIETNYMFFFFIS